MGTGEQQKVVFYFDVQESKFSDSMKIDLDKFTEKNIEFAFREPRDLELPEVCINGYCVAGVKDINHALNSLISS